MIVTFHAASVQRDFNAAAYLDLIRSQMQVGTFNVSATTSHSFTMPKLDVLHVPITGSLAQTDCSVKFVLPVLTLIPEVEIVFLVVKEPILHQQMDAHVSIARRYLAQLPGTATPSSLLF